MANTVHIHHTATAREILEALDYWSTSASLTEITRVWHILTALRGPDGNDPGFALKDATTARIRKEALPNIAKKVGALVAREGVRFGETVKILSTVEGATEHFMGHIKAAVADLGGTYKTIKATCDYAGCYQNPVEDSIFCDEHLSEYA